MPWRQFQLCRRVFFLGGEGLENGDPPTFCHKRAVDQFQLRRHIFLGGPWRPPHSARRGWLINSNFVDGFFLGEGLEKSSPSKTSAKTKSACFFFPQVVWGVGSLAPEIYNGTHYQKTGPATPRQTRNTQVLCRGTSPTGHLQTGLWDQGVYPPLV